MIQKNNEPTKARKMALSILNDHDQSFQTLDEIIENNFKNLNLLSKKDRAFSNSIVYGVIRWRSRLDEITRRLSKRPINSISPIVLNIIRIGLFQLFFMDRVPKSAAINTSVNLAKTIVSSRAAVGYVNGILRNAVRKPELTEIPISKKHSIKQLALLKSFPEWLLARWLKHFGYHETCNLCDAINKIPKMTIRVNTLRTNKKKLKILLNKDAKKIENFALLPNILSISKIKRPIHEMESFSKGLFSVQDGAAQLVSHLLSPNPGERVLDACAGLGGKSTHMAQLMNNQGNIIAIDNIKEKLDKLANESHRLGIKIIETQHLDLNLKSNLNNKYLFDRILIDAPCSGLGVIRRNPDTKWSRSPKNLTNCSRKQLRLLSNVSLLVKPQGTLAYAVCSTEMEENEYVIKSFLQRNQHFKIKKTYPQNIDKLSSYLGKDGFFRTYPHLHEMDSFFVALLKRIY